MSKKKAVLISNVFVGSYGYSKENLPHEVINFFMTDDEKFYYYVPPYGLYKSEDYQIEKIVFVRNIGNGILEILAQAEGLHCHVEGITYSKNNENNKELIQNLIDIQETVKYGGRSIEEIYKREEKDWHVFLSGEADTISIPKTSIFITTDEKKAVGGITYLPLKSENSKDKPAKLNNQSMLYYVTEENEEAYKILLELGNQFRPIEKYTPEGIADDHSFVKILRQQDAEVSFSNMLFWFVSEYETVRNCFVEKVLGLNNFFDNSNTVIIEREKKRMDLSIRVISNDDKREKIIIVENKIKSGINGASTDSPNEKERSEGVVSDNEGFKSKEENGTLKRISQLSKYYEIARDEYHVPEDNIKTFILAPEYYKQVIESEKSKYLYGDKYNIISYKKLRDIFMAEDFSKAITGKEEIRFNDFITSLEKHTKVVDDEFRNEMMIRLRNRIEQKK